MEKYAKEKACTRKPLKMVLLDELVFDFCDSLRNHEGCDE